MLLSTKQFRPQDLRLPTLHDTAAYIQTGLLIPFEHADLPITMGRHL